MTPQDQKQAQILSVGGTDTVREQDKIMLVLSYLGVLALIPLLTVKDSDFVKWHAKQGLILGVGGFIVMTLLAFLGPLGFTNCLLAPGTLRAVRDGNHQGHERCPLAHSVGRRSGRQALAVVFL